MFFQGFQPQHVGLCVQEHVQFWFVFILKYIDQRLCVITLTPIGFSWMGSFDTGTVRTRVGHAYAEYAEYVEYAEYADAD